MLKRKTRDMFRLFHKLEDLQASEGSAGSNVPIHTFDNGLSMIWYIEMKLEALQWFNIANKICFRLRANTTRDEFRCDFITISKSKTCEKSDLRSSKDSLSNWKIQLWMKICENVFSKLKRRRKKLFLIPRWHSKTLSLKRESL